jgi:hypothetical protein
VVEALGCSHILPTQPIIQTCTSKLNSRDNSAFVMAATNSAMKSMKQLSLAETGFQPKAGKATRKAVFLAEMDMVVQWLRK